MFTVFRGILIVLTFMKYGMIGGFTRVILSMVAIKVATFFFLGVVFPILMTFAMIKIQGLVVGYVLDYVNNSVDLTDFPVALQLSGIAAYLFTALGLDTALNMILTASSIRFALSLSIFRK